MGYAVLHYNNNNTVPIGNIIFDIAGVLTGTYTSVNQITTSGFNSNLSTIVNSAGRGNWEFVYPATHGTKSTTSHTFVLRAPCISSGSKYKFVQLISQAGTSTLQSSGNLYNIGNSGAIGLLVRGCTAATSTTALSNPTYYNTFSSSSFDYRSSSRTIFTGPYFYMSWSSRHLLIISSVLGQDTFLAHVGIFEHTETSISLYRNVAPFCYHSYWSNEYTANPDPVYIDNGSKYSSFVIFNHYNPATTISSGSVSLHGSGQQFSVQHYYDTPVVSQDNTTYPTTYTKNSSGANAMFLQPLFFHQHHIGVPHAYISNLCDVYRAPSGLGNANDLLTVGGDTYVYFPMGSTTYALAVKRA